MTSNEVHPFGWLDYFVFSAMLVVSAGTGFYHAFAGDGQKTVSKYLMADRNMFSIPVAISTLASFLSAVSILGIPAEIFIHGIQYWMVALSFIISMPITAWVFIPVFHELKLTSAYEYLHRRFSMSIRLFGSVLFIIQTSFYMAIVLYAPALALEAVTKFEVWKTVLITGLICTAYTSLGGIKAVIWTDVFQFFVLFGALLTVIIMGTAYTGGLSHVWQFNQEQGHANFFEFTWDPTVRLSFWSTIIGGTCNTLSLWAVSQTAVQRFLTAKSQKEAVKSVWLNLPGNIIMFSTVSFIGMILFAFYNNGNVQDGIESHMTPDYQSADQILVYFVSSELGIIPGIQGLFVACIFAGTLSTEASGLNALATVTFVDIIKPLRVNRYHGNHAVNSAKMDSRDTKISKLLSFFYGAVCIGLAFVASQLGTLVKSVNSVLGAAGGPLLGVFSLGLLSRRANTGGAFVGLLSGFASAVWIVVGAMVYKDPQTGGVLPNAFVLYRISFMLYSAVSFLMTIVVGLLASEVIRCAIPEERLKTVDPSLLAPFLRPKGWQPPVVTRKENSNLSFEDSILDNLEQDDDDRDNERKVLIVDDRQYLP
ncbi:sodium-dependent multivitamin transporter-like [Ptychodera flava]|uniref:sodium-dependent multivitamin transporter-like n=1 Tax=Ptychodera flava TaxID=63121 RepID=UPI003969BDC3